MKITENNEVFKNLTGSESVRTLAVGSGRVATVIE